MTNTLTKAEELRNDIDNLCFTIRYYFGVLAELEQLGRTHTAEFKRAEQNLKVLKNNKARLEADEIKYEIRVARNYEELEKNANQRPKTR